jgi:hypothetical protein
MAAPTTQLRAWATIYLDVAAENLAKVKGCLDDEDANGALLYLRSAAHDLGVAQGHTEALELLGAPVKRLRRRHDSIDRKITAANKAAEEEFEHAWDTDYLVDR